MSNQWWNFVPVWKDPLPIHLHIKWSLCGRQQASRHGRFRFALEKTEVYIPRYTSLDPDLERADEATFVGTLVFILMFKVKSFTVETFNRLPFVVQYLYSVWRVHLLTPRTWQQGYIQCNYIMQAYTRLIATNWLKKYHEYDHLILIIYIDIFIHLNNNVHIIDHGLNLKLKLTWKSTDKVTDIAFLTG